MVSKTGEKQFFLILMIHSKKDERGLRGPFQYSHLTYFSGLVQPAVPCLSYRSHQSLAS